MNGSTVVALGVRRHRVGCDNSARRRLVRAYSRAPNYVFLPTRSLGAATESAAQSLLS
jgi:hypothetical protein